MEDLDEWLSESYPTAYRTACLVLRSPADAEDAVQEAFLRVWRFRDAIPTGDGRKAWLYRVVVNACLSRLRSDKHWRERVGDDDLISSRPAGDLGPHLLAEAAALSEAVSAAVDDLPDTLRIPVVLRYFTGLSEKDIALAIQRRPGTVKSRLSDARAKLATNPALAAWATAEEA